MKRFARWALAGAALFAGAIYLNNTSLFSSGDGHALLLAHRGLAQTYPSEGLGSDTCTASRIHPPEHPFLENTLAAMEAAFAHGADIVELDIHPTTDGHFAVFHDWTLDCRTDGSGVTRDRTLAELKRLDVGYGYTADGGKTFPFRGKGVGLIPSLEEVLATFPDRRLLIHIKSNDASEGEKLSAALSELPPERLAMLMVYGGDAPVAVVRERLPLRTMSRGQLKRCLTTYLAIGWTGIVPAACERSVLLVPVNYAALLWGWPNRFLARMRAAGSEVFVIGPWKGGDFSTGIDDIETLQRLPPDFSGGIWTNRVDRIAPALGRRSQPGGQDASDATRGRG